MLHVPKRWAIVALVAVTAIVSSLATLAVAGNGVVTGTGTDITRVKTVSSSSLTSTSSTVDVDLSGASRSIQVSGGSALLVARFTAESSCGSAGVSTGCFIRIVADDGTTITDMNPPGSDASFDSDSTCLPSSGTCSANDGFESHAIERSLTVGPGTYVVQVRVRVGCACLTFSLDEWHLTVERIV